MLVEDTTSGSEDSHGDATDGLGVLSADSPPLVLRAMPLAASSLA